MTTHRKVLGVATGLLLASVAFAGTAQAQTDTRWTPFFGCWQPAGGTSDGSMICFRPLESEGGVEMLTVADGEIAVTETFRADGTAQSIEREGCRGSESAEFSSDNRRIYTRSLYTCEGDVTRTASGIMSLTSPTQWLDVRSIGVDGEQMAWVQFYEAASAFTVEEVGLADITASLGMAIRSSRMAASVALDVEDVLDAADHVDAKTVEAWVAERGDGFNLTGDALVALADAGLDGSLIDVMVAVSNPNHFTVDGQMQSVAAGGAPSAASMRSGWNRFPYGRAYDPYFFDPFYYGLSSRYSYGYSPWGYGGGYGSYGGYGWYGGYTPTPVVVTPVDDSPRGRVVNGRGYSRGGRTPASSSGRASSSAGAGGSGSSQRGAVSRTSGSSGTATSSSGTSSRGSSTGRTARRRGGGG